MPVRAEAANVCSYSRPPARLPALRNVAERTIGVFKNRFRYFEAVGVVSLDYAGECSVRFDCGAQLHKYE
jgi:hypothetical protein